MSHQHGDMSPLVDMTQLRMVGPARSSQPRYVDLLPPCNNACPAGEDIQGWLSLAQAGKFHAAWQHLVRDNPLPAVHGRVCYHLCESACNRGELDTSVSIHAIERLLGDKADAENWTLPVDAKSSGKRVLIVGAGPSGLSAAFHLTRLGHHVDIHEAGPLPGGMLHFGIPAYRLPRDVLMREIARIEAMGVKITLDHKVEDILAEQAAGKYDAVFLAIGTQIGKRSDIPARDAARVIDAITLLHEVETGDSPRLGRRVIVYGGGNTAMDAARTARRLGAEETLIVYRRDRVHMTAQAFESAEALSEGIKIKWLSTIKEIDGDDITVETMRLDDQGRAQPTGQFETLTADSVVLALGQQTESGFLKGVSGIAFTADGSLVVDKAMMTGHPGVFAGGDMVPGDRTVTAAVGHGKKAARHIDAWLRGEIRQVAARHPMVGFDQLKLPIYADAPRSIQREVDAESRIVRGFSETMDGLSEAEALYEAQRCLSCGNCFECDNCFAACPETAIIKLGPSHGYRVDMALCTGCAVCVEQCPCHAMEMVPEIIPQPTKTLEAAQ
ncbi:NAD(P)-binding protein [Telmatospirillum siberiense]|uniref:Glutamate synthase n=1 Tax=Telmatospirillum siberiense TaxID=382514 RepID=A0A2N3PRK7_9PROT|nr:NAD(P)-binding protein [Telmatospirillum siberiense]PKU23039.1 glutamate synthase [Telmatospirillum siberiense]